MVYGKTSTPTNKREQIWKDGRVYSSQAAADKGPTPRRRQGSHTFQTQRRVSGIREWLASK
jgi:hypothetical protein